MGERRVRNAEVEGSNPLPSTKQGATRAAWLRIHPGNRVSRRS